MAIPSLCSGQTHFPILSFHLVIPRSQGDEESFSRITREGSKGKAVIELFPLPPEEDYDKGEANQG